MGLVGGNVIEKRREEVSTSKAKQHYRVEQNTERHTEMDGECLFLLKRGTFNINVGGSKAIVADRLVAHAITICSYNQ
ncbi:hypothetical protein VNO77_01276 [Canavalia gladiata]|uniref:Uncharacterized protein n=1 Tax=Canavalia gladiata TaxID=3824 RepID=A0AAN9MST2_CANGL